MYTRNNIEFKTENDLILRGWFYTPKQSHFPAPCIIMAHGFSGLKEQYLDQYAARFAAAGMFVLVYDNRNFGASDGECRLEVDPAAQIVDMRNAITFVQGLKNVDPNRIGLWGTSFSAGIAIEVAAIDKRVASVVAQVPFVSGHHQFLKLKKPEMWDEISKKYAADRQARIAGKPPAMVALVSKDPQESVVMKQPEAYEFFISFKEWQNKVTLRSVENAGDFYPIAHIDQVSPAALLFIVADHDTLNPTNLAVKAYEKALEPKKLVMIEGNHFAPYIEKFEQCANAALEWFSHYLLTEEKLS